MAFFLDLEKLAWATEELKNRRCLVRAIVHGDNSMKNCTYVQGTKDS